VANAQLGARRINVNEEYQTFNLMSSSGCFRKGPRYPYETSCDWMKTNYSYGYRIRCQTGRTSRRAKTMPVSKIGTSSVKPGSGVATGEIV